MSFAWPLIFLFIPLPLLVYWLAPRASKADTALKVPFASRAKTASMQGTHTQTRITKRLRVTVFYIIWLLLVVSAANPQHLGEAQSIPMSGRDLMVAVDISNSMATADMLIQGQELARLVVVKFIVGEFLTKRQGDRVGLILFGSNAYLQAPLTFDLVTVNQFLQEATLKIAGEKTAIGDAIGLAVKRLKDRPESQRVLILLTDGENTAGNIEPTHAADLAKQAGVKIHTIGIGADRSQRGIFGLPRLSNSASEIDEATLKYIADTTGGKYFRARNPDELVEVYTQLDKIEEIQQNDKFERPIESLYHKPLLAALLLIFGYGLIENLKPQPLLPKLFRTKKVKL